MCRLKKKIVYRNCNKPNFNTNIREGIIIIQPINDFSDKYMVPIDSESFKTPSLTPHILSDSKLNCFFDFSKKSWYRNFEHLKKKQ